MYIPNQIIDFMDKVGTCGIYVYCPPTETQEIYEFLKQTFESEWEKALEKTKQFDHFVDLGYNPIPLDITIKNNCVFLTGEELSIQYNEDVGEVNVDDGIEALEETLRQLVAKYPNVRYEGQVAFRWSDHLGGDVVQFELSYPDPIDGFSDKTYDFIGEALAKGVDWDELDFEEEEDYAAALKCVFAYSKWIGLDCIDKILDLAEDYDSDLRDELEELLESLKKDEEE